jgi:hypothetical protein
VLRWRNIKLWAQFGLATYQPKQTMVAQVCNGRRVGVRLYMILWVYNIFTVVAGCGNSPTKRCDRLRAFLNW